jgi:hypothetical protein
MSDYRDKEKTTRPDGRDTEKHGGLVTNPGLSLCISVELREKLRVTPWLNLPIPPLVFTGF